MAEWKVTDKELLSSQGLTGQSQVKPSSAISPLIENFDEDSSEEEDYEESFHTKQLFSFAWQIAKGMVITVIFYCFIFYKTCPAWGNLYNRQQAEDSPERVPFFRLPTRKGRDFIS